MEARSALVTATQRSGRVRAVVSDQRSEPTGVAFSSDGRTLATVDRKGTVRLWDGATARRAGTPSQERSVAFSPDGETLVLGGEDGMLTFRNLADGSTAGETDAGVGPIGYIASSPTGETLAVTGTDGAREPGNPEVRGYDLFDNLSTSRFPRHRSWWPCRSRPTGARSRVGSFFEGASLLDVRTGERSVSRSGSTSIRVRS